MLAVEPPAGSETEVVAVIVANPAPSAFQGRLDVDMSCEYKQRFVADGSIK